MRFYITFLSLFLLFSFSGCNRASWLEGKWTFDRDYTEAHIPKPSGQESPAQNPLDSMREHLAATMVTPQLLAKLDGVELTFTRKEMIATMKGGSGQAQKYEVIERPTSDSVRIKTADGKVQTYEREGDRIATATEGDVHFKVYFKHATK